MIQRWSLFVMMGVTWALGLASSRCVSIDDRKLSNDPDGGKGLNVDGAVPSSDGAVSHDQSSGAGGGAAGGELGDARAAAQDGSSGHGGNGVQLGNDAGQGDAVTNGGSGGGGAAEGAAGKSGQGVGGAGGTISCAKSGSKGLDLIDDMEDGNALFTDNVGRKGAWWLGRDPVDGGVIQPAENVSPVEILTEPRGSSQRAIHFSGTGFTGPDRWASLQAHLKLEAGNTKPYDASAYLGLHFYAKGSGGLQVKVQTVATAAEESGGTCKPTATRSCYNAFSRDVPLESQWKEHTVFFCELSQSDWGDDKVAFDPSTLLRIAFDPGSRASGNPERWDYWIDDVSFVTLGGFPAKLALIPQDGWVDSSSNDVGIHGAWYGFTDGQSSLELSEKTGRVCFKGTVAARSTNLWGVYGALRLNQVDGAESLYDASAHGVVGFRYKLTGAALPQNLQIGFHSPTAEGVSNYCIVHQPASDAVVTTRIADTKLNCYDQTSTSAPDATRLQMFYFSVPTETAAQAFDFCVSDLKAVTNVAP